MEFSKYYQWPKGNIPEDKPKDNETLFPKPVEAKKEAPSQEPAGFAEIMKPREISEGDIFATYMEMLEFTEEILGKVKNDLPLSVAEIEERVKKLVEEVMAGGKFFMEFVLEDVKEEQKARHLLNTTILSLEIGLELGYNKSKLMEIAAGTLLHDVGIVKLVALTSTSKKLTKTEYEEIKRHPLYGREVLKRIGELSEEIIRIAHEHHERLDGSGYPQGLKNGHIHEHALMVGIVDMFEAMTHTRPYRRKKSPYEALRELINMGAHCIEPRYVEALVRCIGLYPIGSWVELSTGEIGKVIETNKNVPLRPVLTVLYDQRGHKLSEGKLIDTSKHPIIYIRAVLSDEELSAKIST